MIKRTPLPTFGNEKIPWSDIETYIETTWSNLELLGTASDGTSKIYAKEFGTKGKPCIYLQFGVHGDEWESVHHGLEIMRYLSRLKSTPDTKRDIERLLSNFCFYVIPCLNPYGYINNIQNNANGVNINRNYPAFWSELDDDEKGNSPADQPETQYTIAKINHYRPFLFIDGHAHGNQFVRNLIYYNGTEFESFFKDVAKSLNYSFGGNIKPGTPLDTAAIHNPFERPLAATYARTIGTTTGRPMLAYTLEPGQGKAKEIVFQMGVNMVFFTILHAEDYFHKNKLTQ